LNTNKQTKNFQAHDLAVLTSVPILLERLDEQRRKTKLPLRVHKSAKLVNGKFLRLKPPLSLPYCDAKHRGESIYCQVVLLFSIGEKELALASVLQDETRKSNQQVRLA
jgi:hypothetical protein